MLFVICIILCIHSTFFRMLYYISLYFFVILFIHSHYSFVSQFLTFINGFSLSNKNMLNKKKLKTWTTTTKKQNIKMQKEEKKMVIKAKYEWTHIDIFLLIFRLNDIKIIVDKAFPKRNANSIGWTIEKRFVYCWIAKFICSLL